MRQIARGLLGENLPGEVAPLSFCLSSGGEEIRGAPLVFMPDLNQKRLYRCWKTTTGKEYLYL